MKLKKTSVIQNIKNIFNKDEILSFAEYKNYFFLKLILSQSLENRLNSMSII